MFSRSFISNLINIFLCKRNRCYLRDVDDFTVSDFASIFRNETGLMYLIRFRRGHTFSTNSNFLNFALRLKDLNQNIFHGRKLFYATLGKYSFTLQARCVILFMYLISHPSCIWLVLCVSDYRAKEFVV